MSSDNAALNKANMRPTYYKAKDYLGFSDLEEESDPIEHSNSSKPDPSPKDSPKTSSKFRSPLKLEYDHNAFFLQPHEKSQDLWWDPKGNSPKEEGNTLTQPCISTQHHTSTRPMHLDLSLYTLTQHLPCNSKRPSRYD